MATDNYLKKTRPETIERRRAMFGTTEQTSQFMDKLSEHLDGSEYTKVKLFIILVIAT